MEYVLGIESGGTKMIAQLARLDGAVVARLNAPSIADVAPNPAVAQQGMRAVLGELGQMPDTGEIRAVYASLGGLNLQTVVEAVRTFLPNVVVEAHRESSGDVVCGCAPWWGFDIAVMAGTGTVALGRGRDGQHRKVGGWGCWIEDPGSGFEIGRDALRAVTRMLDFGEPETSLLVAFAEHDLFRDTLMALPPEALRLAASREAHRDEIGEAVKAAYPHLERRSISSLCPLVEDCADDGDAVARQILEDAGERAADYAVQLARHLELPAPRVIGMGSILLNVPAVFGSFRDAVRRVLPSARVDICDFTLAAGSVLRALELAGVTIDREIVDRLRRTGSLTMAKPIPEGMSDAMATEAVDDRFADLDQKSSLEIVSLINEEDRTVAEAVQKVLPEIAAAVDILVDAFAKGGRLFYVGAGTSGRLGIVDASECPPTYGTSPEMVQGIIAGGKSAVFQAREGCEDREFAGARDLARRGVGPKDVVCALSCSGRTPYAMGALRKARAAGARTLAVYCNPQGILGELADVAIVPVTGPEVVAGSTRMKAGTAEKMVLNMLTTAAMVRSGRVAGNMMTHMSVSCEKLQYRAAGIIMRRLGISAEDAAQRLADAGNNLAVALQDSPTD